MAIKGKQLDLKSRYEPFTWLSPSMIIFGIFLVYPIIYSIVLSFFEWSGYTREPFAKFIGFENYIRLVNDDIFWLAFKNTLIVVFCNVFIMIAVSLFLALVIFFGNFRNNNLIRAIIFFPGVISQVIIALVFRKFLEIEGGVNLLLGLFGLKNLAQAWLINENLAIWICSFIIVWQWVGYIMIIFYAALQGVDQNLIEAAFIDGASLQKAIFSIVIPIIKPAIFLAALINFIGGFRVYAIIWVLTRGGPIHASEVLTTYIYFQSFSRYGPSDMSYASTMAVVLAMIVLIFGVIRIKYFAKEQQ